MNRVRGSGGYVPTGTSALPDDFTWPMRPMQPMIPMTPSTWPHPSTLQIENDNLRDEIEQLRIENERLKKENEKLRQRLIDSKISF